MPNFTKIAIKQSFVKLLNERPLKQITVRDIVEDCGINRNSFYYHFSDIPTLLEEIIMDDAIRIIAEHPAVDNIEDCLIAVIEFARENKRAIMHIYNSVNRELYEQYLWQVAEGIVTAYAANVMEGTIDENDRRILIQFYKCACFGLTTEWIRTGMHSDIQADIKRLCELKRGTVEEELRRCTRQE
jgi:AcrR family transcriptional regulator